MEKINVTKTHLPDREKYKIYIDRIFDSGWLTNNGQLVQELEKKLCNYLGVENLLLVTNGTMALQIAYKALGIQNEAITTPFSFVATTSSLVWEGINPVFADIDKYTLNINPDKIQERISRRTSAIVPVHVFGNACEIEKIQKIASENHLKVIFDAAHAFGVKYKNQSILNYGDASILSFHSTKVFHTIEGGAIVFKDKTIYNKAKLMINFGIPDYDKISELGINCKMNEFQAAMGLCVLEDINNILFKRKEFYEVYREAFSHKPQLQLQTLNEMGSYNYAYFPIVFESESKLMEIKNILNAAGIYPRRYFYPSLENLAYLKSNQVTPVSDSVSLRILCLPLYEGLNNNIQEKIIKIIRTNI